MTRSILIDGVERSDITRVESLRITNKASGDGEAGLGELILDDPDGELIDDGNRPDIRKTWAITEDATASPTVLGFGRIGNFETFRHEQRYLDRQVDWKLYLEDANIEMRGFDVHGQSRPIETDYERVQWVASTYLNGSPRASTVLDFSTYVPNTNTVTMEAKTYNNSEVTDVLRDCAEQADKIFFVTPDAELFYDQKDSTAYTSTVSISDRPADINQTDVFEPIWDQGPALDWEGQTYASRLRLSYGLEQSVLVGPDAGEADHDYWVGRTFDSGALSTSQATAVANGELAFRAKGVRTYSLSLLLANDQVDLIKVGQRIQIKARAAVDVDNAYVYRRIAQLQWEVESPEFYWAHLQLDQPLTAHSKNTRGSPATSVAKVISPCPCVEPFTRTVADPGLGLSPLSYQDWQIDSIVVTGDVSVDGSKAVFDFSAGSAQGQIFTHVPIVPVSNARFEVLALFRSDRNSSPGTAVGQELTLGLYSVSGTFGASEALGPDAHGIFRINNTASGGTVSIRANMFLREQGGTGQAGTGFIFSPIVTYTDSGYIGEPFWVRYKCSGNTTYLRGWLDGDPEPSDWQQTDEQSPVNNYEFSANLMDRLYLSASGNGGGGSGTQMIWYVDYIEVISGIWCCASAPSSGQFITNQNIGFGNGSDTYHVYADAYVPGSLRVWVDGLEQTATVTESDPTTGEFTLGFTPDDTEQIMVSYEVG